LTQYIIELQTAMTEVWEIAADRRAHAQDRSRQRHQPTRPIHQFQPGDLFFKRSIPQCHILDPDDLIAHRISLKLQDRYTGPHVVIHQLSPVTYRCSVNGRIQVVHLNYTMYATNDATYLMTKILSKNVQQRKHRTMSLNFVTPTTSSLSNMTNKRRKKKHLNSSATTLSMMGTKNKNVVKIMTWSPGEHWEDYQADDTADYVISWTINLTDIININLPKTNYLSKNYPRTLPTGTIQDELPTIF
jgi:hypothetical protein